jgi:hypothetical protein
MRPPYAQPPHRCAPSGPVRKHRPTGCPAGCSPGGHECGVGEPIDFDPSLYDCSAAFVPSMTGVRLTCEHRCIGACSQRVAA